MIQLKVTAQPDVAILNCPRCDTALLPAGEWPIGGPTEARCPLCGWQEPVEVVEVGDAFPYNPGQQREDAALSPVYAAAAITIDEDLVLVDIPGLLADPAFYALQDGVAPVRSFGWVGGSGLLGEERYRLFLVVRVTGLQEDDLFRVEFPPGLIAKLAVVKDDQTMVLVSERKGVFFPEAGEVYLQAVREAGGEPGETVVINTWVTLEDEAAG
jgi:hypothetical protein